MSDPYMKFGMNIADATADYIESSAKDSPQARAFWAGWVSSLLMKIDRKAGEAAILAYRDGHKDD